MGRPFHPISPSPLPSAHPTTSGPRHSSVAAVVAATSAALDEQRRERAGVTLHRLNVDVAPSQQPSSSGTPRPNNTIGENNNNNNAGGIPRAGTTPRSSGHRATRPNSRLRHLATLRRRRRTSISTQEPPNVTNASTPPSLQRVITPVINNNNNSSNLNSSTNATANNPNNVNPNSPAITNNTTTATIPVHLTSTPITDPHAATRRLLRAIATAGETSTDPPRRTPNSHRRVGHNLAQYDYEREFEIELERQRELHDLEEELETDLASVVAGHSIPTSDICYTLLLVENRRWLEWLLSENSRSQRLLLRTTSRVRSPTSQHRPFARRRSFAVFVDHYFDAMIRQCDELFQRLRAARTRGRRNFRARASERRQTATGSNNRNSREGNHDHEDEQRFLRIASHRNAIELVAQREREEEVMDEGNAREEGHAEQAEAEGEQEEEDAEEQEQGEGDEEEEEEDADQEGGAEGADGGSGGAEEEGEGENEQGEEAGEQMEDEEGSGRGENAETGGDREAVFVAMADGETTQNDDRETRRNNREEASSQVEDPEDNGENQGTVPHNSNTMTLHEEGIPENTRVVRMARNANGQQRHPSRSPRERTRDWDRDQDRVITGDRERVRESDRERDRVRTAQHARSRRRSETEQHIERAGRREIPSAANNSGARVGGTAVGAADLSIPFPSVLDTGIDMQDLVAEDNDEDLTPVDAIRLMSELNERAFHRELNRIELGSIYNHANQNNNNNNNNRINNDNTEGDAEMTEATTHPASANANAADATTTGNIRLRRLQRAFVRIQHLQRQSNELMEVMQTTAARSRAAAREFSSASSTYLRLLQQQRAFEQQQHLAQHGNEGGDVEAAGETERILREVEMQVSAEGRAERERRIGAGGDNSDGADGDDGQQQHRRSSRRRRRRRIIIYERVGNNTGNNNNNNNNHHHSNGTAPSTTMTTAAAPEASTEQDLTAGTSGLSIVSSAVGINNGNGDRSALTTTAANHHNSGSGGNQNTRRIGRMSTEDATAAATAITLASASIRRRNSLGAGSLSSRTPVEVRHFERIIDPARLTVTYRETRSVPPLSSSTANLHHGGASAHIHAHRSTEAGGGSNVNGSAGTSSRHQAPTSS